MKFLAFEGIDGSGKSTLIQFLFEKLKSLDVKTIVTREPGGTDLSEEIRQILIRVDGEAPKARTELLLYQAARAQHVDRVIQPALNKGRWVLCDRFTASSLAFQAGGRKINEEEIIWLNHYATAGLTPDLNILLDLSPEEGQKRRMVRYDNSLDSQDRFEREKIQFHQNVRDHYLKQSQENPQKWLILDAAKAPEDVFNDLISELESRKWLS